ncbi:MAG: flagellar hook-basal body complex protein FliE [Lachnospiraceae bacterium]|jgi:flagellar hook-basal body complex protein FliE|nr:flagellar hook-basal body complex protein FliE [Lachnospiraceae bacterium]
MEGAAFITPMMPWNTIGRQDETQYTTAVNAEASLFKDVFKNTINQVKETQADVEYKQYLLATGQLDDVHTLPIAEAKAGLSLDVLISLRNKTLESYNELIKISV